MKPKNSEEKSKVIKIESAEQLKKLTDRTLPCRFELDGELIEVPVTRMSTATAEQVRAIRREAQPPWDKVRSDYLHTDANYLKSRDQNESIARSLMVYAHCPMVAAMKPALNDRNLIHQFVNTVFPESVLDVLAMFIQKSGLQIRLEERLNFSSTSASES